ncbi:MAG: ATP-binding cassette domain-containing protein [Maritimibacter sp.]
MLTLEGLHVGLGGFDLRADFSVPKGAQVAVIGPSGAGKSTLLAAIAGFQELRKGRVTWEGADLTDKAAADRPVSMIFQDNNLFPHMTLFENVGLGVRPDLRLSSGEVARVEGALDAVGLAGLGARKPGAVSGGQMARAGLARALLRARPLMLLDEPFGALGPALRQEMIQLVSRLARESGASLLMVTHNPDDALAIQGEVILVAAGVAHAPEPAAEIFANPPEALRAYLGES